MFRKKSSPSAAFAGHLGGVWPRVCPRRQRRVTAHDGAMLPEAPAPTWLPARGSRREGGASAALLGFVYTRRQRPARGRVLARLRAIFAPSARAGRQRSGCVTSTGPACRRRRGGPRGCRGTHTHVAKRSTAERVALERGRSERAGLFRPLAHAVRDIGAMDLRSQSELRRSKTPVLLSRGARDRMEAFGAGVVYTASSGPSRARCQTGVIIRLSMRHSLTLRVGAARRCTADAGRLGGAVRRAVSSIGEFVQVGRRFRSGTRARFRHRGAGIAHGSRGRGGALSGQGIARGMSIC